MANDETEIGYAESFLQYIVSAHLQASIRMGVAHFFGSFALLGGQPIDGRLLNPGLHWAKPIAFSGVSHLSQRHCLVHSKSISRQAMMLAGGAGLILSRYQLSVRKNTWRV